MGISQMDHGRVAVVMAVYNGAELLEDSLKSVIRQSVKPAEVILVNDGSQDQSLAVLKRFKKDFGKILSVKILDQQNLGQGSARNLGVAAASSDYIAFIDQDDSWPVAHIRKLHESLDRDETLGWVYSDFCQIDGGGQTLRRGFLKGTKYLPPSQSVFSMLSQDLMMLPSASLIRREAFLEVGGFDTQFRGYEDDDLFLRIFLAGWSFKFEAEPVTNYRTHVNNSSRNFTFLVSRSKFYKKYDLEFFPDGTEYRNEFLGAIGGRLTRAYLIDSIAAHRMPNDLEFRKVLTETCKELFDLVGWTLKRRIVYFVTRHPSYVPALMWLWLKYLKFTGRHKKAVF